MGAAPRVGVLVQRRAVELRERELVAREVRRHPVEEDADAGGVHRVDEGAKLVRRAERRDGRVEARHLIPPGARERVMHDRQQLDVRVAEVLHVRHELLGELAPPEPEPPRRRVHLVDRERPDEQVLGAAGGQPVVVLPLVAGAVDDRCGLRRHLCRERERVGLEAKLAVAPDDLELVLRALARAGDDGVPDAGRAGRLEQVDVAVPAVPVADHRDLLGVRRPHGERHAAVDEMGAELLVDPLVPALAREMEVELTQPAAGRRRGRLRHQNSASSIRRIPATGIPTQSGRLSSS